MEDDYDYSIHSKYWAYSHPDWKPKCKRCCERKLNCKKYNSKELGSFAGEWICKDCVRTTDYKTPYELTIEKLTKE